MIYWLFQGPPGVTGPAGSQGEVGAPGVPGVQGERGPIGALGPRVSRSPSSKYNQLVPFENGMLNCIFFVILCLSLKEFLCDERLRRRVKPDQRRQYFSFMEPMKCWMWPCVLDRARMETWVPLVKTGPPELSVLPVRQESREPTVNAVMTWVAFWASNQRMLHPPFVLL